MNEMIQSNPIENSLPQGSNITTKNNFFTFFGNIIFILLIILSIIISAGIYFIAKNMPNIINLPFLDSSELKLNLSPGLQPTALPIQSSANALLSSAPILLPTSSPISKQQVLNLIQSINISTNDYHYNIKAPNGWKIFQKIENYTTENIISNEDYSLIIRKNMATEGAPCGFPDAPLAPSEMYPDISGYIYNTYKEFKGKQGQIYRRVDITANTSGEKKHFILCQKREEENNWFIPTIFGFISYEIPYANELSNNDLLMLETMDAMVASLDNKN